MYQSKGAIAHKIDVTIAEIAKFNNKQNSAVVAISGGVDSAVTAKLAKESGLIVRGVYANCWNSPDAYNCDVPAQADAINTAKEIDIKLKITNLSKEYKEHVLDVFITQYRAGMTPNPDILCNSQIKFGLIGKQECVKDEVFMTGHYAKTHAVEYDQHLQSHSSAMQNPNFALCKNDQNKIPETFPRYIGIPVDQKKDQSYYLCDFIDDEFVKSVYFPLGNLYKSEVRNIAAYFGLSAAKKPDSQGICFIGDVKLRKFIAKYSKSKKGRVYDQNMNLIGEHDGAHFYTIGQRHGFKLFGYNPLPLYIINKNTNENYLVVATKEKCFGNDVYLTNIKFAAGYDLQKIINNNNLSLRVRSLGQLYKIDRLSSNNNLLKISTTDPIFAIAPGQYGAIYQNGYIICSGVIVKPVSDSYNNL